MAFSLSNQPSTPRQAVMNRLEKSVAGLVVTLGLTLASLSCLPAQSAETPAQLKQVQSSQATQNTPSLSDGLYLYGQATEPEQIGSAYMVFEVTQGRVVGAFYMPHSSFDCFNGEFQSNQLALNVVDSYEQTVNPYAIALQADSSVASSTGAVTPVGLEGFHRLESLSENDHRILATCQADFQ